MILPGSSSCCHLNPNLLKTTFSVPHCSPDIETLSLYAFGFCLPEGTLNIITMAYVWNQTPRSTDFKKTCSTWPSDSNLFSKNRGTTGNRHAAHFWDRYCCFSWDWGKEFDFRFKPVQKFDACSGENYSGGGQPNPGAAEQTVIAQSQHHQQFLGQLLFSVHKPQNTRDAPKYTYECFHIVFPPLWFYCFCFFSFYSPTDASRALPDFVELDLGQNNAENIALEDVKALQSLYREHCEVRWSPFCWYALQSCQGSTQPRAVNRGDRGVGSIFSAQ